MKKWLVRGTLAVVALVAVFNVYMYWLMKQPPERFTQGIARLPQPAMMLSPFPILWAKARAGAVQPGDLAPDFELQTSDRAAKVRLSEHRGVRPVVLVFGSYT